MLTFIEGSLMDGITKDNLVIRSNNIVSNKGTRKFRNKKILSIIR